MYLSIHLSIYLSIFLSIYLSINLSIYQSIYQSIYLPLSQFFILNPALSFFLLHRLIPFRSFYVPNLKKAYGLSLIDIVLEFTFPQIDLTNGKARREKNITNRNGDKNCNQGVVNNIFNKIKDNNNNLYINSRKSINNDSSIADDSKKIDYPLVFQMKDSESSTVKFEFYDDKQYKNLIDRFTAEDSFVFPNTVQIFFKSVHVKSVFSDRVTKLRASQDSDFIIQKYQHLNSDLVSETLKISV